MDNGRDDSAIADADEYHWEEETCRKENYVVDPVGYRPRSIIPGTGCQETFWYVGRESEKW